MLGGAGGCDPYPGTSNSGVLRQLDSWTCDTGMAWESDQLNLTSTSSLPHSGIIFYGKVSQLLHDP